MYKYATYPGSPYLLQHALWVRHSVHEVGSQHKVKSARKALSKVGCIIVLESIQLVRVYLRTC